MDFFDSMPFSVWSMLSYRAPKVRLLKKVSLAIFLFFMAFSVFTFLYTPALYSSLLNFTPPERLKLSFLIWLFQMRIADFMTIWAMYIGPLANAVIIFIESKVKHKELAKFARNIEFIDTKLQQDFRIDIQATTEKWQMRWRIFRIAAIAVLIWMSYYLVTPLFMRSYQNKVSAYSGYFGTMWIYFGPSMIVIQLYFLRIETFVHAIGHRYRLISECIERIERVHCFNDMDFLSNDEEVCRLLNSDEAVDMLQNLRRIHRLLYSATQTINRCFAWTLCLFIIQSVVHSIFLIYITIKLYNLPLQESVLHKLWLMLLPLVVYMIPLALTCDFTINEVCFVYLLLLLDCRLFTCFRNHSQKIDWRVLYFGSCRRLRSVEIYTKSILARVEDVLRNW